MTMTPAEITRKVQQVENDVEDICVMLSQVQGTLRRQANRIDEIDRKVEALDARVETRFDGLETRLDGLETRFDGLDAKVDLMGTKIDEILARLS